MYQGVGTPWCPMYRESFSIALNLQAHETPFKDTFIQNLSNISINYKLQKHFIHVWKIKIFFAQEFLVPSTIESFWKSNHTVKKQKSQTALDHL